MPSDRSDWTGYMADHWVGPDRILNLVAIAGWSSDGGSSPFRALTDGGDFWVKPLNNTQTPRVTINELVIGRLGRLIGAPVCDVEVIGIGPDLAGEPFCRARTLEPGVASGSRDVRDVNPKRMLDHRMEDDNQRRHAGVLALYDWCWGADDQWLYESAAQNRVHSHDHGHFLPGGPDWTIALLEAHVDEPHQIAGDTGGLDIPTVEEYAARLQAVTAEQIRCILGSVPRQWPVEVEELEALGWFLANRAEQVGDRMMEIARLLKGVQGR